MKVTATVIYDILIYLAYYTKPVRDYRHEKFDSYDYEMYLDIAVADLVSPYKTEEELKDKIRSKTSTTPELVDYALDYLLSNEMQGFVLIANNKYRLSSQSPFLNLSLFSPRVLDDQFDYFRYPDGKTIQPYIDEIVSLQVIFAEFFSAGIKGKIRDKDGSLTNKDLTKLVSFPVVTLAVANDKIGSEHLQEKDDEFIDKILRLFSRYHNLNIYKGVKLAMCCFDGCQLAETENKVSSFKDLYDEGKDYRVYSKGEYKDASILRLKRDDRDVYKVITSNLDELIMTDNHINVTNKGDKRTDELTTDDLLETYSKETLSGYVTIDSIEKIEDYNEEYVYCFQMKDESDPYFTLPNGVHTGNCRLVVENNRKNTHETGMSSLGVVTNSTSYNAVGSLRVVSIGLPSIALELSKENRNIDNYLKLLEPKVDLVVKILNAQRKLIEQRTEEEFYDFTENQGVINDKLASTIGGMGLYEAVKLLSGNEWGTMYTQDELDIANEILKFVDKKCADASKDTGKIFNMELSIPGESSAFRLKKRDVINFGDEVNYPELSNQFLPATIDANLNEKLRVENELCKYIPSTTIAHLNIDSNLSAEQTVQLHKRIWDAYPDLSHYAFNPVSYLCENGHLNTTTTNNDVCIECEGEIVDRSTRSIGYIRSIDYEFGKNRKDEQSRRKYYKLK